MSRLHLILVIAVLAACSDGFPEADFVEIDTVVVDVAEVDTPDIGEVACETDEDCLPHVQCCLDVACLQGRCMPRYVPDCCTTEGPCAVDVPHHIGTCATTCVAGGCEHRLNLTDRGCGQVLWELGGPDTLTLVDDQPDRVVWHRSPLRPFDGEPTWRAGDLLCPTYHNGPLGPDCEPLGESGATRTAFDTLAVAVAADAPTVLEFVVFGELGAEVGQAVAGIDRLEVIAIPDGLAASVLWTSSPEQGAGEPLPQRAWTPVYVDLSRYAGRTVRLRFVLDTLDGRDNDHEGVAIARARIRTVCAADRNVTGQGVCLVGRDVTIHPLQDTLPSVTPPLAPLDLHERACEACVDASTCTRLDPCDEASCERGRCELTQELNSQCCSPEPRWSGDGSFEAALEGWELDGGWGVRALASSEGDLALHFGQEDGSALAPDGQRATGLALGPPIRVHDQAPRWRFALQLSTEWDLSPSMENPRGIDLLEAVVLLAADPRQPPEQVVVWDSRQISGTTSGLWRDIAIPLDRFAGREVRLGWRFDTVDGEANRPGAVFVDEVSLIRACPDCDPEVESCDPRTGR